jgi:hypothetical protein
LQVGNRTRQRALELRPSERARQPRHADRLEFGIEAHVHLPGTRMAHTQRPDRKPAVKNRQHQRFQQAEVPAGRCEGNFDCAKFETP